MSKLLVCVVLLVGIIAMACGGSDDAPTPTMPLEPAAQAGAVSAEIKGFSHQDLTVKAGATVTWTNGDNTSHTTTADGGEWDSDRLQGGATFSFTFTDPGTYDYHCNIHGSMTATVTP